MEIDQKIRLVERPPTQEVITMQELRKLFEEKDKPGHYIGLEISGLLHLGSLVLTGFKLKDLIAAGVKATVYLADWHSAINRKLGGDWVRIVLGSDLYRGNDAYWKNVLEFSKHVSIARATRTLTIMGRSAKEKLDLAQYFYPPMQSVDIHELQADIAHAGMDQRKVHMLAREVYPKLGWKPPVALHHELLLGLRKPERGGLDEEEVQDMLISSKMSKSHPEASIFIHDKEEEIEDKMKKAFCPAKEVNFNPVLQYVRLLIFHEKNEFRVERPAKFGGDIDFKNYQEVEKAYAEGQLHPADLKASVARELNEMVRDVRAHFERRFEEIKSLLS